MSGSIESLRRKIEQARSLGTVVRAMKNMAAMNIRQYEEAVRSLGEYSRTIDLGLWACLQQDGFHNGGRTDNRGNTLPSVVVVFGSDQGLVGQFNDRLELLAREYLARPGTPPSILAVGERIMLKLREEGYESERIFEVPGSVNTITTLIASLLEAIETAGRHTTGFELCLIHHRPIEAGLSKPETIRLLPLDRTWAEGIRANAAPWPGHLHPELPNGLETTRWALVREYLFVSLYRACAESLASENANRLSAMQRAEKNIDELLEELTMSHNEQRQATIDEELFDVISGFKALEEIDGVTLMHPEEDETE
jgi:F-type H+-transporting ATPase subunit gamma